MPSRRRVGALIAGLPCAHAEFCYSQPDDGDRLGDDYTIRGHLSAETLGPLSIPSHADAYLCGPVGFMDQLSAVLSGLGIDRARIFTEPFGAHDAITPGVVGHATAPPHLPAGPPGTGPAVSFARSNLTANWGSGYASLLEFAEACGVPVRWSCRTGVCHTCETPLLSGIGRLLARTRRPARRRQRAGVLHPTPGRPRSGPLNPGRALRRRACGAFAHGTESCPISPFVPAAPTALGCTAQGSDAWFGLATHRAVTAPLASPATTPREAWRGAMCESP